jgi:cyclopropane fatty-acyl-phospholipid synthase-like methyltransferase
MAVFTSIGGRKMSWRFACRLSAIVAGETGSNDLRVVNFIDRHWFPGGCCVASVASV